MTSSIKKKIVMKFADGTPLDLTELPPVTLGDKRRMKADGVKWEDVASGDPDAESAFVLLVLRKVRPATTAEEVDALPAKVTQDIVRHAISTSAAVDSPLSPSSTPSAGITGGAETN